MEGEEGDEDLTDWQNEKNKWQARRYREEYYQTIGKLVPVEHVEQIFGAVGDQLHNALGSMCEECSEATLAALDQAEQIITEEFPTDDPDQSQPASGDELASPEERQAAERYATKKAKEQAREET